MLYAGELLNNSNLFISGASHREAQSTIFKVFCMTQPGVDSNPRFQTLSANSTITL